MTEWVGSTHNRGDERFCLPFSLGDIAAIKIVYTTPPQKGKFPHHGMFHKQMVRNCHFHDDAMYNTCHCWLIGEPICAGVLMCRDQNHWSCCFNKDENSKACGNNQWDNDHSGFWHFPATTKVDENLLKNKFKKCFDRGNSSYRPQVDVFCRKTTYPTYCGRGCTYGGTKPHWDCCHNENFESHCKPDRKK